MRKGLVLFFIAGALEGAVWIKTYDAGYTETLTSASATSDGGFILLGSKGDSVLLIKLDSLGNPEWGKVYGDTLPLYPASVIQTTDGGYVILGKKGSITPSIFVIKTTSSGDTTWAKEIGFSASITSLDLASIIQTLDGNYTLVGSLFAGITTSAIMVKLNTSGNVIGSRFLNGAFYHEFPTGLLQIPGGNYVVAGYLIQSGSPAPFLMKTDSSGNLRWWKSYTSAPNRKIFSLDTFSNGFVMAGVSDSSGLIMRVDTGGNPRWAKTYSSYSSSDGVRFNSIRRTLGGFVLTGKIGNNVLLVKTDTSGNVIWAKRFSTFSSAEGISLRVLGDGIFIGGNSNNDLLTIKTNISGMVPSCDTLVTDVSLDTTNLPISAGSVTTASVSLSLSSPTPLSLSLSTPSITTNTVCLDTTRPYVVLTVPANGETGVAPNTSITVVFSERIDTSTVDTLSIRIVVRSNRRTFAKSCSSSYSECVLTPTPPFNYGDTVRVYFDTLITDLAGNRLIPDSIYFVVRDSIGGSDTTRPRIVLTHPDSGSIYVPLSANIGIWFSKPIIDTTINASSVSITGWDGSSFRNYSFNRTCPMPNFCVLDPILNFRPNEEITVRFDSTIMDTSGNPLIPKVIVFRTQGVDTLNPVVVFTTPDSGAVNVPSNTKIAVQFSRDMDTTTINTTNVIISGSRSGLHTFTKVCRTLSYCEINPVPSFNNDETITVEFRSGIMALNGRNLVPRIITFTTGSLDNNSPSITIISDLHD
ncbi:Ig-like domain-containing protein, partial [Candidatus Caldipriscus sp.]|nr:Ig-like domain-containing protein [Candidatus Caldipriscus sp.]